MNSTDSSVSLSFKWNFTWRDLKNILYISWRELSLKISENLLKAKILPLGTHHTSECFNSNRKGPLIYMSEQFNLLECICFYDNVECIKFSLQYQIKIFTRRFRENSLYTSEESIELEWRGRHSSIQMEFNLKRFREFSKFLKMKSHSKQAKIHSKRDDCYSKPRELMFDSKRRTDS